jgi:deoxyhypusine synthase
MAEKEFYLNPKRTVEHIDIKSFNSIPIIEAMGKTAFQARNLHRASEIINMLVSENGTSTILTLAGSLISAGMKAAIVDMMKANMIDAIVSTGANIVDQDFLEALGFKHYQGTQFVDDNELRELMIDRIYDTYIDEDDLRVCDMTVAEIMNSLDPRAYSSRELIQEMGRWLVDNNQGEDSIIRTAFEKGIPIFVPAFSDCSAGFGLVHHQFNTKGPVVSVDSAKDFLEITKLKIKAKETGILMLGGGVPKNFTQDIVVAAEVLGYDVPMHKYAVQITVADERDGGLSGSTLKEASSWGKVETTYEQMVFSEVTIAFPLLASYVYHKGQWKNRTEKRYNDFLDQEVQF